MLAPGLVNQAKDAGPGTIPWWPDWRGQAAAIIASGPTAKKAGVDQLRGRLKVMAINQSYELAPWADVLYGCDGKWWSLQAWGEKFKGLKITQDPTASVYGPSDSIKKIDIPNVENDDLLVDRPGRIGAGGNSGFQGLNLAVQFGATRIMLVGFDMRTDLGTHWHGRHPPDLNNPCPDYNLPRWRRALDRAAAKLAQLGIEVVNCSEVSLLTAYPKMTIAQALERWHL